MKKSVFVFLLTLAFSAAFSQNYTWVRGSKMNGAQGVYGTKGTAAPANDPGSRHGAATWTDSNGDLWLFGGEGLDTSSTLCWLNDLWKFDVTAGQWTWIRGSNGPNAAGVYGTQGVPSSTNEPGAREFMVTWTDNNGKFWMFGGDGFDGTNTYGRLADLWHYDPATNQWTFMKGYTLADQAGVYGTKGTPAPGNLPGARYGAATWTDASGNLWLFGGRAPFSGPNFLNDLWKYNIASNQWTWMSGANTANQVSVHGVKGVSAPTNMPGAREYPAFWVSLSGDLYMHGGRGWSATNMGWLNDLWRYNTVSNEWTWIHGASTVNQQSAYGTMAVPSTTTTPGARYSAACWRDMSGDFWLFGGNGYAASVGLLSDLFRYNPQSNQWTHMKGPVTVNNNGSYGIQGVAHPANNPGGRYYNTWWKESGGRFWIIGGLGYDSLSTFTDNMNDLWYYVPPCNADSIHTSAQMLCTGNSATFTAFNQVPATVNWYSSPTGTTAIGTGSVYATPPLTAASSQSVYTFYAESNSCTMTPRASVSITVQPLPVLAISSQTAVCNGSSIVFTASGAATYTWNTGAQTLTTAVTPTTTSYTVYLLGRSNFSCESNASKTITVFPLPVITVSAAAPPRFCPGSSATLTAAGALTYSWSTAQSSNAIVVAPKTTTSYTVSGTDANGCTSSAAITQTTDVCASLAGDESVEEGFSIYPNPTNGKFTVKMQVPQAATVLVMNALAQVLYSAQLTSETVVETGLPAGIYYVLISGEQGLVARLPLVIE